MQINATTAVFSPVFLFPSFFLSLGILLYKRLIEMKKSFFVRAKWAETDDEK